MFSRPPEHMKTYRDRSRNVTHEYFCCCCAFVVAYVNSRIVRPNTVEHIFNGMKFIVRMFKCVSRNTVAGMRKRIFIFIAPEQTNERKSSSLKPTHSYSLLTQALHVCVCDFGFAILFIWCDMRIYS